MKRAPLTPAPALVCVLATLPLSAQEGASAAGSLTETLSPLDVVRVERGLEQRYACLGCHRIGGRGGAIGPSLDGISERADVEYVRSIIRDPAAVVPGTLMPRQPMPQTEVRRLTRYLLSLPPADAPPPTAPEAPSVLAAADSLDGAALYARNCAACHGASGAGDGWNAGNLPVAPTVHADPVLMSRRPDDTLFDGIAAGGFVLDKSTRMPAFGEMLSPAQMRALVTHIRALCDCREPAWAGDGAGGR
ncbi:MAG: cytochrome c [Longimicrobiales bacterium]|nr:cytochrome c [Longimicrobiales bacterium]